MNPAYWFLLFKVGNATPPAKIVCARAQAYAPGSVAVTNYAIGATAVESYTPGSRPNGEREDATR